MKATDDQREQIDTFFALMSDHLDDVILYPVIDKKTGEERLSICVARDNEDGSHDIFMVGILMNPDSDTLVDRLFFKEDESPVITKRKNWLLDLISKLFKGEK